MRPSRRQIDFQYGAPPRQPQHRVACPQPQEGPAFSGCPDHGWPRPRRHRGVGCQSCRPAVSLAVRFGLPLGFGLPSGLIRRLDDRSRATILGGGVIGVRTRLRRLRVDGWPFVWRAEISHVRGSGDCHRCIRVRAWGAGERSQALQADLLSLTWPAPWGACASDGAYPEAADMRAAIGYAMEHGWQPDRLGGTFVMSEREHAALFSLPGFLLTDRLASDRSGVWRSGVWRSSVWRSSVRAFGDRPFAGAGRRVADGGRRGPHGPGHRCLRGSPARLIGYRRHSRHAGIPFFAGLSRGAPACFLPGKPSLLNCGDAADQLIRAAMVRAHTRDSVYEVSTSRS